MKMLLPVVGILPCIAFMAANSRGAAPDSFNKMLDRYRNATVFSCQGDITTAAKGSPIQSKKTFTLSFQRPNQLNLELVEKTPFIRSKTNRVFMLDGKPYSQVGPSFRRKEEASPYEALRSCRGPSAGASELIPVLLLGTNAFNMDTVIQKDDEQVEGMRCFHFSALTIHKQPVEVFIDQKQLSILKLERSFKIDAKDVPPNAPGLQKLVGSEFETVITCRDVKFN